jgi:hypothetical protein
MYTPDGELVSPSKKELLNVLLFLKGAFSPDTFDIFANDDEKRYALVRSMSKPSLYMSILAGSADRPNFDLLENGVEHLSISECAQYMIYCLRLMYSQGGNDAICEMWKKGTIEKLVNRMLHQIDTCEIS